MSLLQFKQQIYSGKFYPLDIGRYVKLFNFQFKIQTFKKPVLRDNQVDTFCELFLFRLHTFYIAILTLKLFRIKAGQLIAVSSELTPSP